MKVPLAMMLTTLCALTGCSDGKRIPAVGPGYEIIVFSTEKSRALGDRVARVLSREVLYLRREPLFQTVSESYADVSFYRTRKILFAVGTPEDEPLRALLRQAGGEPVHTAFPGLWIVTEPFSAGQILLVYSGEGAVLLSQLQEEEDAFVERVEEAACTLLHTNLFRAGATAGARRAMVERWGWGVRLASDWVVDDRYAEESFVRIWRDAPVCQMFVSWEEGRVDRTPQEWLARRSLLVDRFYEGDQVVEGRSVASHGKMPGAPDGVRLEGLWENDRYVIGGPFESWSFWCAEDDRTYLVDLCVYAPDRDKRPLMRTLEAVAQSFQCGCVPERVSRKGGSS